MERKTDNQEDPLEERVWDILKQAVDEPHKMVQSWLKIVTEIRGLNERAKPTIDQKNEGRNPAKGQSPQSDEAL